MNDDVQRTTENRPAPRNFCAACNKKEFTEEPVGSRYNKRTCIACGFTWAAARLQPGETVIMTE